MKKRQGEDRILTIPNVISVIRILLIPLFLILLYNENNIAAFVVFVVSSISDGLDGFIARKFNQVSKLGVVLDPIADRGLLLAGSLMLCIIGRLPLWILVLVLIRDLSFLLGGLYLMRTCNWKPKVIMLGKIATTFFYIGFSLLVLAWPIANGVGLIYLSWLPGFNNQIYYVGIWPVYIGILLNLYTSTHYIKTAFQKLKEVKNAND